jgi:hypothetical protein
MEQLNWDFILLLIGGIGTAFNFLKQSWKDALMSPFVRKKDEAESQRDTKSAELDVDTIIDTHIKELRLSVKELQDQEIQNSTIILNLHREMNRNKLDCDMALNKYKQAIIEFVRLCDLICDQKEACKDKIFEVMASLNIEEENEEGTIT